MTGSFDLSQLAPGQRWMDCEGDVWTVTDDLRMWATSKDAAISPQHVFASYPPLTLLEHRSPSVGKYRKKPVVIEAMRMPERPTPVEGMAVYRWVEENTLGSFEPMACIEGREPWPASGITIDPRDGRIVIATLEGGHWVDLGDYVIRGVKGEFYPCKPDIFAATYDEVEP